MVKLSPNVTTLFSWGYAGWGRSLPQLFAVTEAAERARGFDPPVFVDVRFSRSVRAEGFRDKTFESALPAGRYRWMKGLGNAGIGDGGEMRIHRPEDAAALLDLAIEEAARRRRVIFFCSCGPVEGCHRNLVRELVLDEALRRQIDVEIAEWPGGEPAEEVVCALEVTAAVFGKIVHGAPRIPIDEAHALQHFAAHPWGGFIDINDGMRSATASVGPAKYSAGKWFVEPFVGPIAEGDTLDDVYLAAFQYREEAGYVVYRAAEEADDEASAPPAGDDVEADAPSPLEEVFTMLDRWRHFPAYQLERRADVFFAVYLREVLQGELGLALHETILPELPLKRDLIWPERPSSASVKVDYALFAADLSTVYFVELKTDVGSRRSEQDEYLQRARELGFKAIVEGICQIALATSAHQKYHHLIAALAELGFVSLPEDLRDYLYPEPRVGLTERLRAIEVHDVDAAIEVHYIQPVASAGDAIDFETYAKYVERHDDPLSELFAAHLRRWAIAAGSTAPA